ncbi:hypothetical protein [Pseudomonas sp. R5(2019)]|uniref:hypothetical protein n=1 Tax=Pseudomonas sp. R5(2019) TaxID=2697566 RepID=UPI0014135BD1|nr:hypothetical protein [Pseudomonas sp. R5(2019)]NBA94200.1 hypothetical protein [Pseudomonas sp. R5(2019)]
MNNDQVLKELREELAQLAEEMRRPPRSAARAALVPVALGASVALLAALVGFKLFF